MKRMTLVMCAVLALATIATAAVRTDQFNDGSPSPLWRRDVDVIKMRENGRLQFRSSVAQGGEHASLYEARGWQFDYTRNFTINVQYRLRPGQVTGGRYAVVAMVLETSGEADEVVIGVRRDAGGLKAFIEITLENDVVVYQDEVPITRSQAKLQVKYRADPDRLDVLVGGDLVLRIHDLLDGVNVGNGRAKLSLAAGRRGNQFWGWNDVWLDKFKITGNIID